MEFTQNLLSQMLTAKISKVPPALVADKVKRLKTLAPIMIELLSQAEIHWQPLCAFEVQEANAANHEFVLFSGRLTSESGAMESWGLCLHHKANRDAPTISCYLVPTPSMSQLTKFRRFINCVLRHLGSAAHLSFVHLEKSDGVRWRVVSMKYGNGTSSPVPKIFYRTVLSLS